jgi:ABC-type transport system involved in multi-copper enzyme maturation permease subunit
VLTWRDLFATYLRLFTLSARIVFQKKILFMTGGIATYYAILYAIAVFRPGEGFSVEQALHVLVEAPGTVLAIYLTMDLVASERDKDTLEILFSTAASHHTTWGIRMVAVLGVLTVSIISMSLISYYIFAEFPYGWGGLNALAPSLFIACLTFLFSTLCRSGNASAMLSLGVLLVILVTAETLKETPYFLFLNPLSPPSNIDEDLWFEQALYNRVTIIISGALFIFFALRRMGTREKIL